MGRYFVNLTIKMNRRPPIYQIVFRFNICLRELLYFFCVVHLFLI